MDPERALDDLDKRIAKARGWVDVRTAPSGKLIGRAPSAMREYLDLPLFSRDLEAAWSVARWLMDTHGAAFTVGSRYGEWWAEFTQPGYSTGVGTGATPPEAICRAALLALEVLRGEG